VSSPKHDLRDVAARFARKARSDEITLDKLVAARQAVARLRAWLAELLPPKEDLLADEQSPTLPATAPDMVAAVARPGYVVRVMMVRPATWTSPRC